MQVFITKNVGITRFFYNYNDNHWQQFWYVLSSKGPSNLPFTCAITDYAGPLFCYSNGVPLSRSQFTKELRTLLAQGGHHPAHYAGHSFRIEAATTAASQGLPHWLIQTLGRWSSDCYLRYIRTPIHVLTDVSKRLIAE